MQLTTSLITSLEDNYPQFIFVPSDNFWWSPTDSTIHYNPKLKNSTALLLHELSHAVLGHKDCVSDIRLIAMERQAWDYAAKLSLIYDVKISKNIIQSSLDSYREWLHKRSTCPKCTAIGLQDNVCKYKCLACNYTWQVNQAKKCKLKRYSL